MAQDRFGSSKRTCALRPQLWRGNVPQLQSLAFAVPISISGALLCSSLVALGFAPRHCECCQGTQACKPQHAESRNRRTSHFILYKFIDSLYYIMYISIYVCMISRYALAMARCITGGRQPLQPRGPQCLEDKVCARSQCWCWAQVSRAWWPPTPCNTSAPEPSDI